MGLLDHIFTSVSGGELWEHDKNEEFWIKGVHDQALGGGGKNDISLSFGKITPLQVPTVFAFLLVVSLDKNFDY